MSVQCQSLQNGISTSWDQNCPPTCLADVQVNFSIIYRRRNLLTVSNSSDFCDFLNYFNEYSTNSVFCDTTTASPAYLTELKVYEPTLQLCFFLILLFFVFPLCICTCLVRDLLLMLHCLSRIVSLVNLDQQTHSHLWNHLWNLSLLQDVFTLCVWLSVHVYMHMHINLF